MSPGFRSSIGRVRADLVRV
ncbi:unnamed protein product [Victoria cruziana]